MIYNKDRNIWEYTRRKRSKPNEQREFFEQCEVSHWLDENHPNILYSASTGGMRTTIGVATKNKRAGYKRGCPDITIYEARGGFHGLALELKDDKGILSQDQIKWRKMLTERNYLYLVCYSADEAKKEITAYIKQKDDQVS